MLDYSILSNTLHRGPNCASTFFINERNWFEKIRSEIMVPDSCITEKNGEWYLHFDKSTDTTEISILIITSVTFVMSILIFIGWRSKNPFTVDWLRLVSIYSAATLLFIFILQLAPSTPGFSRFVGFAVIIHNFAELYMLRTIWFGKNSNSFIGIAVVVLYVFLMSAFLAFLNMNTLYLIAMIQGATLDYLFVVTCPFIAWKMKSYPWNYCDWILASAAAFIHILSIQPLFIGFALGNGQITGITTLGLFPTFFLYTYFAGRELGHLGFLGPSYGEYLEHKYHAGMNEVICEIAGNVELISKGENEITTNDPETEEKEDGEENNLIRPLIHKNNHEGEGNIFETNKENVKRAQKFAEEGAIKNLEMSKLEISILFSIAFLLSLLNSLLVWYSPCYVKPDCKV